MSQNLPISGPLGMFCRYVILTISCLRVQTIETSSLPNDSSRPLFKQTVWLYMSTVSTFLNICASYQSASSGFRLLGEIPAGATIACVCCYYFLQVAGQWWVPGLKRLLEHIGAPNDNFRENICSEDDLRSRIFGTFVAKFLACLPLLGFSNI